VKIALLLSVLLCSVAGLAFSPDEPSTDTTPAAIEYGDELLIQIAVADLDAACAFYGEVLGLEMTQRTESLKWAKFALPRGAQLGVGEAESVTGSGTVSINISVVDIDGARALLETRGVVFDGPTIDIPGVVRLADFSDPDGNKIRLAGASG
jgi:predicted enzyme related to lactoylglutathione lyase